MHVAGHDSELDLGPRKIAPGTERLCVATGEVKPVDDMIRFVIGPDGALVPDLKRRLPGRGVWVTATRSALAQAVARRAFARSFRRDVAATDIVALTERLLERSALDALAIAHKAARVVTGFAKVEAALGHDPVAALLHAAGAALDGVRKLNATLQRRSVDGGKDIAVFDAFTAAQLDLALGRSNVVHAALLGGPESDLFVARARRLNRFRPGDAAGGNGKRTTN
jgi:predicted RNA-binding protein YlxR (DUF448 family)